MLRARKLRAPLVNTVNAHRATSSWSRLAVAQKPLTRARSSMVIEEDTKFPKFNTLFEEVDQDKDGKINQNECAVILAKLLGPAQLAALSSVTSPVTRSQMQLLAHRFGVTAEVAVSKIAPAGFGWQLASCIAADNLGFAADSAAFALTTGVGDGLGVLIGHTGYMCLKSLVVDDVDVGEQAQTGVLLASAAFCSGTVWQPVVDALTATGASFTGVAAGTTALCGAAFFAGLRVARRAYSSAMPAIEAPNYSNLNADAWLSVSIGGATGAFVGTDLSQKANWLAPAFGIADGTPTLMGAGIAGSSTATGFLALQTAQNLAMKDGESWLD